MTSSVYVMQDRVSKICGTVFEAVNDEAMRRDFVMLCSNPRVPDYAIADTVVIKLGTFVSDGAMPHLVPEAVPYVVLRGDEFEFTELRKRISVEDSSVPV